MDDFYGKYADIPSPELEKQLENNEIPEDDIFLVCFLLHQRKEYADLGDAIYQ